MGTPKIVDVDLLRAERDVEKALNRFRVIGANLIRHSTATDIIELIALAKRLPDAIDQLEDAACRFGELDQVSEANGWQTRLSAVLARK